MLAACCSPAPAFAATRIDFNQGWLFRTDPDGIGEASGWIRSIPADTQSVSLPHTWNIGEFHDYLGVAWYFRRFAHAAQAAGDACGAAFRRHLLQGARLVEWRGIGHPRGRIHGLLLRYLHALARWQYALVVQIDNRPGAFTIPGFGARGTPDAWYDWWAFGGIVRDVWLTQSGPAWIRRQRIRSEQNADRALIRDQVFFGSSQARAAAGCASPHTAPMTSRLAAPRSR